MPETAFLGAQIAPKSLSAGASPRPHWESLQRSTRPPSWIQGALLLRGGDGREGREDPEKFLRIGPAFSALTLLAGRQERHRACKKLEW